MLYNSFIYLLSKLAFYVLPTYLPVSAEYYSTSLVRVMYMITVLLLWMTRE